MVFICHMFLGDQVLALMETPPFLLINLLVMGLYIMQDTISMLPSTLG
ncbi:hypothetical protein Golob_007732 [Gossypium lobatum]|uniref:Uncharacterized protein n=1 Tax=Gossypium lobatum TaxID=34289 RepID=A0A7J8MD96_9ROSI|nr:hypothetical protein [Gossypium lobatum]